MHLALDELARFYQTPMGLQVRRLLAHRIRARWRDVRGLTVCGLGYPFPYLGSFRQEAGRLGALLPMNSGQHTAVGVPWPDDGPVHTVLVEAAALPLPDDSVDCLLGIHALEFAENRRQTLREIWRVLRPEGRMLLVLPNRRGLWANREGTPFGQGEPYSRGQIERLLDSSMFSVDACSFALATPPIELGMLWRPGTGLERLGCAVWPGLAGVVLVEATKRVTAVLPKASPRSVAARLRPLAVKPARLPSAARTEPPTHR